MKLEVGQTVELNNGEIYEVTRENEFGRFYICGMSYTSDGVWWSGDENHPLSVKRIIKEPDSKPEWPDLSNHDKVPFEDMTDEQQAFMLLADHQDEIIQFLCSEKWVDRNGPRFFLSTVYRLKPAAPSWLPLEVGKVYVDEEGIERRCIAVEGDNAWLVRNGRDDASAYVWDASTGKAKHLLSSNLTGPAQADPAASEESKP